MFTIRSWQLKAQFMLLESKIRPQESTLGKNFCLTHVLEMAFIAQ